MTFQIQNSNDSQQQPLNSSHNGTNPTDAQSQKPKPVLSKVEGSKIQNETTLSPAKLAEIWAHRAYELAKEPPAEATGQTVDLLVFWLGDERYGLEVTSVREIHPLEQITPVPRTPNFVAGVFSARGRILSVIDLQAFFGLPAIQLSDQTKIIVVANTDPSSETGHMEVGILADAVEDVLNIFKDSIEPPLTTHNGAQAECLQGVTADMLIVLDLNVLLNDKRLVVYEEIM